MDSHRLSARRDEGGETVCEPPYAANSPFPTKELLTIPSLRTRMAYVQQREQTLEEKRTHCKYFSPLRIPTERLMRIDVKVVKAFESALALLSEP